MAIRPAVIGAAFKCIKCFVGLLQTKMIGALICSPKPVIDPLQADGVSEPSGKFVLIRSVGIHFDHTCPDLFFFLTGVTAGTNGDIQFAISAKGYGAGKVPAAVFIAKAVIRVGRESLGMSVGWLCFAVGEFSTR